MNRGVKPKPLITIKRRRRKSAAKSRNSSQNLQSAKSTVDSPQTRSSQPSQANLLRSRLQNSASRPNIFASRRAKTRTKVSPLSLVIKVAVFAVGISTIIGSGLSWADSWQQSSLRSSLPNTYQPAITQSNQSSQVAKLEKLFSLSAIGQEIDPLRQELMALEAKYPDLEAGIFIADIANKSFVSIAGTSSFSAASTIKLPILVAFFQEVDAGKVSLKEKLATSKENIGGGSGYMQYQPEGTEYSALRTATSMITVSDNTATNMIMERVGGAGKLNQKFQEWGLAETRIRNLLPDLTGTNTTSPEDLSNLLLKIDRGELVSPESRKQILKIMKQTRTNTLLPQGLEPDATIAHKTGDIKSVLGDSGLIYLPTGKRYIASVLVKRPDNDPQARAMIQEISRITYQYFKGQTTPETTVSNSLN